MEQVHSDAVAIAPLPRLSWVGYPAARSVLARLDELIDLPKTHRMPNMVLTAPTNNGKTWLLRRFVDRHVGEPDPDTEQSSIPIVMIDVPPEASESRLYQALLERLLSPGPNREPIDTKLHRLKHILERLGTRILILDEFSNALAGGPVHQMKFLNAIKGLGNALQIPIVVAGVPQIGALLRRDPQLANRFEPYHLPSWESEPRQYVRLLRTFEQAVGFDASPLFSRGAFVKEWLRQTDGLIGETATLFTRIAERAVAQGRRAVVEEDIGKEVLAAVRWTRPSERVSEA